MERNRRTTDRHNLCSGPGKLVQALGLGLEHNGASLVSPELHILKRSALPQIVAGPRVGISRAIDKPWRFMVAGSPWITKHKLNNAAREIHVVTPRLKRSLLPWLSLSAFRLGVGINQEGG